MFKKLFLIFLVLVLACFCGCGKTQSETYPSIVKGYPLIFESDSDQGNHSVLSAYSKTEFLWLIQLAKEAPDRTIWDLESLTNYYVLDNKSFDDNINTISISKDIVELSYSLPYHFLFWSYNDSIKVCMHRNNTSITNLAKSESYLRTINYSGRKYREYETVEKDKTLCYYTESDGYIITVKIKEETLNRFNEEDILNIKAEKIKPLELYANDSRMIQLAEIFDLKKKHLLYKNQYEKTDSITLLHYVNQEFYDPFFLSYFDTSSFDSFCDVFLNKSTTFGILLNRNDNISALEYGLEIYKKEPAFYDFIIKLLKMYKTINNIY